MQRQVISRTQTTLWLRFVLIFFVLLVVFASLSAFVLKRVIERQDEQKLMTILRTETSEHENEREVEYEDEYEHEEGEQYEINRGDFERGSLWFRYERASSGKWLTTDDRIVNFSAKMIPAITDWRPQNAEVRRVAVPLPGFDQAEFLVAAMNTERGWLYIGTETGKSTELVTTSLIWMVIFTAVLLLLASVLAWWVTKQALRPVGDAMQRQAHFITNASHEFRTPLAIMRTALDCIHEESELTEYPQIKQWLGDIQEEIQRMTLLIDRLLLLTRFEKGGGLQMERVVLLEMFEQVKKRMDVLAADQNLHIELAGDPQVAAVFDRALMEQVCIILLDNAIKFSPPNGRILFGWREVGISTNQESVGIEMFVQDEGVGIAAENLPHIFEHFYTTDPARAKQTGFGIGLSIAEAIVRAHHGEIQVQSTVGQGSVFKVLI